MSYNDTTEQRTLDKELGLINHQLINAGGISQEHVKIEWKTKTIKVHGKEAAKTGEDNVVEYMGEALSVKDTVKSLLKAWKEKRRID